MQTSKSTPLIYENVFGTSVTRGVSAAKTEVIKMPLLYETVHQPKRLQNGEKVYRIPFPDRVGEGTSRSSGKVTWDPQRTKITSAILSVSGDLVIGGCSIFIPGSGTAEFFFNGNWIFGVRVPESFACIGECHAGFSKAYDILGSLVNGENYVSVEVRKSWGWPVWIELRNLSVYIDVYYEGAKPEIEIKPPPPEWWGYVKWGMIGVGAIAVVGLVLPKAIEAVRKPKG
jgi:hypothetical protein